MSRISGSHALFVESKNRRLNGFQKKEKDPVEYLFTDAPLRYLLMLFVLSDALKFLEVLLVAKLFEVN